MIMQAAAVNYQDLFSITVPETILEIVSLVVLVVDLGWLRKSAQSTRTGAACTLGVLGSVAALMWLLAHPTAAPFADGALVATPLVAAAQVGILVLTALVLLLSFKAEFSRNPGEPAGDLRRA
jgi:NADH-quinone oxidoreductase subunit N